MDRAWLPPSWKAHPELVLEFEALQRKANRILATDSNWASRHGAYLPTEGRGVAEYHLLKGQEAQERREKAKREWDGRLRRELLQRHKERAAAQIAEFRGLVMTVHLRIFRFDQAIRGGEGPRNRLMFSGPADRLQEFLAPNGFTSEEPEFPRFVQFLADLTAAGNTMAEKTYNVVMSLTSPPLQFVLRQEGDLRPWRTDPPVAIEQVRFGESDTFLSHEFIPTRIVPKADSWEFAFEEDLSADVLGYLNSMGPVANDCMDQALIKTWKHSWDSYYEKHPRSTKFTAQLTHRLVQIETGNDVLGGRKNFGQLRKFLGDTNLSVVVMDPWHNTIWKHVRPEGSARPQISPDTLYLVATNGHLYRVPETYSASHDFGKEVKVKAEVRDPKLTYSIPPDIETDWRFCDTYEGVLEVIGETADLPLPELVKGAKKKAEKPVIQIHCLENLLDVFLRLRAERRPKGIEAELGYYGGELTSLTLNLSRAYIKIRQFKVEGEEPKSILGDVSPQAFIKTFDLSRRRLIHRHLKSRYTLNARHAFQTYFRGPLNECYSAVRQAGVGVDIRSAYPSVLSKVEEIPIFSDADEFRVWSNEPIEPDAIYLVERLVDLLPLDRLCLDKRLNLVSGFTLKEFFPPAEPEPVKDLREVPLEALIDEHDWLCKAADRILKGKDAKHPWKFRDRKAVFYSESEVFERVVELDGLIEVARGKVKPPPVKKFKILAWIRPVHLEPNPFPDIARQMVKAVGSNKVSKFGLNSLIGLTGRRSAQTVEAKFTTDHEEAYRHVDNQWDAHNLADGILYFLRSDKFLMTDGFYSISFLVMDRMRVALRDLYQTLTDAGKTVLGLKTDCFVVDAGSEFQLFVFDEWLPVFHAYGKGKRFSDVSALEAEMNLLLNRPEIKSAMTLTGLPLTEDTTIDAAGKYHVEAWPKVVYPPTHEHKEQPQPETLTFPTSGLLSDVALCLKAVVAPSDFNPYPVAIRPNFEYKILDSTFDWFGEATQHVQPGTLVLGAVAGAGKTSCCRRNATGRLLCVVPTHKRIHEFNKDFKASQESWVNNGPLKDRRFGQGVTDLECLTMAKFVGRTFYDDENKEGINPFAFDTIIIDEMFQSDMPDIISCVKVLEKVRDNENPCLILANGDTFQLTNHKSWNNMGENQAYADQFLWRVFPNRVFLDTNWRLKTDKDKATLMRMLAKMKAGAKPFDLLRAEGLEGQMWLSEADLSKIVEGRTKPMQCLTLSNQLGNDLVRRFSGPERVGMGVIGKSDCADFKKAGLFQNKSYEVTGIEGDRYLLKDFEGSFPRIWFRRDLAWTAHSVQGETIEDEYVIFEANEHFADWRWFYTAFSRAEYLSKVWIYAGPSLFDFEFLNSKINEKIRSAKAFDRKEGFDLICDLTIDWFKDTFKDQNFRCAECSCMLAFNWSETDPDTSHRQFSPNRKDNARGHVKRFTNIVCLRCQNGSSHD